jgi:hypothetical protein
MGINSLMKNMCPCEYNKKTFDSVYIDCNYLLHYFIYNCKNDDDLYQKINNYLQYLFETIKITHTLNLIFDGKHPHHMLINPKKQTSIQRGKNRKESTDYDKQIIEPHGQIVKTFKNLLIDSIKILKKINKIDFEININDDTIDDEADFKILEGINESIYKNICIISRDSDMIVIAYSMICKKNINIDILSKLRPIEFINVNKLNNNYGLDYAFIVLFLGNDYLPKLSNVNYEIIINNYEKYIKHGYLPIIQNNTVNIDNLIIYLSYIIIDKKIKFNLKKINYNRFTIYYNNLLWCLQKYKIIINDNVYIEDTKNVINIFNFVNS